MYIQRWQCPTDLFNQIFHSAVFTVKSFIVETRALGFPDCFRPCTSTCLVKSHSDIIVFTYGSIMITCHFNRMSSRIVKAQLQSTVHPQNFQRFLDSRLPIGSWNTKVGLPTRTEVQSQHFKKRPPKTNRVSLPALKVDTADTYQLAQARDINRPPLNTSLSEAINMISNSPIPTVYNIKCISISPLGWWVDIVILFIYFSLRLYNPI
jgi:hypothetical protein